MAERRPWYEPDGHGPLAEHRDTWTCPACGAVHYLDPALDGSDLSCGCREGEW